MKPTPFSSLLLKFDALKFAQANSFTSVRAAKLLGVKSNFDPQELFSYEEFEMRELGDSPWRVGVLFSDTGVTAAVERTQRAGTLLAIEEINAAGGVLGREIEPMVRDPMSRPSLYRELAIRLCEDDRVSVILGCHTSSSRKAVLPVVESHGALLFYPQLYEGFEYSPHCVYTGAAPNQNSVQLVRYLVKHYGKRVFFVGSDYIYPHESNRIIADLFRQAGGTVLDEIYVPMRVAEIDFTSVLRKIRKHKPDVVYSTVVGDGAALFYQAYRDAGFDTRTHPIASQSTQEAEIAQMLPGVAEGCITAAPYFPSMAGDANLRFVTAYRERYGDDSPISSCAEAAYFQVHLYAQTLERAGSDRLSSLRAQLHEHEYAAPQGTVRIDPENQHTYLWPKVGKVDAAGVFAVVDDPGVCVKPDPYMIESHFDEMARHFV